jgi:hypothetical protein
MKLKEDPAVLVEDLVVLVELLGLVDLEMKVDILQ